MPGLGLVIHDGPDRAGTVVELWPSGGWILWVLFIALPAIVIYAIGHLLGFW
jgi:hypothetical protein